MDEKSKGGKVTEKSMGDSKQKERRKTELNKKIKIEEQNKYFKKALGGTEKKKRRQQKEERDRKDRSKERRRDRGKGDKKSIQEAEKEKGSGRRRKTERSMDMRRRETKKEFRENM